ncbi:MAG: HIT domain-containing protein [Patescibacteria group bacterium]
MNNDCIFCKIIKNEIPSNKVYEDANFLAFMDIQPVSDGHLLVIPKTHVEWMQDADDETVAGAFKISKKLMTSIKNSIGCDYVQVSVVGKDIPHFHIHLIPRYFDDGFKGYETKTYKEGESKVIAEKIISVL